MQVQPMEGPLHDALTPKEIVAYLWDAGWIASGVREPLEQRILACVEHARNEGRLQGLTDAVAKAEQAVKHTKGDRQMAVAQRVLSAVKALLPGEAAKSRELAKAHEQGYGRGFRDGKHSAAKERKFSGSFQTGKTPGLD
jgi:hypothetical protein